MTGDYRLTFALAATRDLTTADGDDALAAVVGTISAHCIVEGAGHNGTMARTVRRVSVQFVAASNAEAEAITRDAMHEVKLPHDDVRLCVRVGRRWVGLPLAADCTRPVNDTEDNR